MAADLVEIRLLRRTERFAFGRGNPITDLGGGLFGMQQHLEFSHGLGAGLTPSFGHHGRLIPATDGREVLQAVDLALMGFQLLI